MTRAHVEGLKKRVLDEGLAVDSVNFVLNVLAAAMNRAVEWDLLKKSPVFKVKRLKARGMRMRCLSEEEAAAPRGVAIPRLILVTFCPGAGFLMLYFKGEMRR